MTKNILKYTLFNVIFSAQYFFHFLVFIFLQTNLLTVIIKLLERKNKEYSKSFSHIQYHFSSKKLYFHNYYRIS